jgi:CBS domain-containing protein
MHVGDLTQTDFVIGIGPEMPVQHAAERMAEEGVGCLVVVGQDGTLAGMVTDRDLAVRVLAAGLDPRRTPVSRAMTPDPVTIPHAAEIEEAARLMRDHRVRRLPVLDVDGRVVGVLSLDDLLATAGSELSDLCVVVESVRRAVRSGGVA